MGHRSYLGNVIYGQTMQKIVTAGMDHRISLIALNQIKEENWVKVKEEQGGMTLTESNIPEQKFKDIFSMGEYHNVRTNSSVYGYGDVFVINDCYCFPTYDSRITVYALK